MHYPLDHQATLEVTAKLYVSLTTEVVLKLIIFRWQIRLMRVENVTCWEYIQ